MSRRVFGSELVSVGFPGFRTGMLLIGLCVSLSSAIAQTSISLRNNSGVILNPESFLDLDIINGNTQSVRVYVQVDLYDVQKKLMGLTTDFFAISPGLNSITYSSVILRNSEYYDEAFREALQEAGVFPPGSYRYEINLVREETGPIANLTGEMQLALGPPQLIYPVNNSQISTKLPVLTWHGPALLSIERHPIRYELKLVELLPGQTAIIAINENPPVFSEKDLAQEALPYPANAKELEIGKSYAWQVIAYSRRLIIGKTEVWKFTITNEDPRRPALPNGTYITLRENLDAGNARFTNVLLFKVNGFTARNEPLVKFYDEQNKDITPGELHVIQEYGDNRIAIDLTPFKDFKSGGLYLMELRSAEGKLYKLRFNYFKDKSHEGKKRKFLGLF